MGYVRRELGKRHLTFEELKDTGKTKVWGVESTHSEDVLGKIRWYWAWRRYVFFPEPYTFFDVDCMNTISKFIADEMEKRKKQSLKSKSSAPPADTGP